MIQQLKAFYMYFAELYLEPLNSFYGMDGYSSGIMRVAFARGNLELNAGGVLYDNSVLSGGVVLSQFEPCRSMQGIKENPTKNVPWGNDYHVYGLTWREGNFIVEFHVNTTDYHIHIPYIYSRFNTTERR